MSLRTTQRQRGLWEATREHWQVRMPKSHGNGCAIPPAGDGAPTTKHARILTSTWQQANIRRPSDDVPSVQLHSRRRHSGILVKVETRRCTSMLTQRDQAHRLQLLCTIRTGNLQPQPSQALTRACAPRSKVNPFATAGESLSVSACNNLPPRSFAAAIASSSLRIRRRTNAGKEKKILRKYYAM